MKTSDAPYHDSLTAKPWLAWGGFGSAKLNFEKGGTYTYETTTPSLNGGTSIINTTSGTWTLDDDTLTVTGLKALDDGKTKLVDAVVKYRVEWLNGNKQLKLTEVEVRVQATVTRNTLSMSLIGTYD